MKIGRSLRAGDGLSTRALELIRAAGPADEPSQTDENRVHAAIVIAVISGAPPPRTYGPASPS